MRSVERCNWLCPHLGLFAFYCYGDAVDAFDAEAVQVGGVAAGFDLTVSSSEGLAKVRARAYAFELKDKSSFAGVLRAELAVVAP